MNTQKEESRDNFDIISAYIDNECSKQEEIFFLSELDSNRDFKLLYDIEKAFIINFRKHFKRVTPSNEILNKIILSIGEETQRKKSLYLKHKHYALISKILYPFAAVLLLSLGYYIYSNFDDAKRDFVGQSVIAFESFNSNQTKLQYITSNANELSGLINKSINFKAFVPDVKDAVLLGGSVNEMNGLTVVHIVHKRYNQIIYTIQVSRNVLIGRNNFLLDENQRQKMLSGQNWISCGKINGDCTVIWFKNDVICSSVSQIEAKEMAIILTNYK